MKLINLNKYLLEEIYQYTNKKIFLNIIKYNKKLREKLSITKYTYQKYFFNSIITPAYLDNISSLEKYFDKKTLKQLKSEWDTENKLIKPESEPVSIFEEKFENTDIIKFKNYRDKLDELDELINYKISNITELKLSDIDINNIELPCSKLLNLQKLSLENLTITFISDEPKISLNKLIYLKLNNIKVNDEKVIKIKMDNLQYLYITIKNADIENNDNALFYNGFFSNIFGFNFVNILLENVGDNKKKCAEKLFQEKYVGNFKYLNLKLFRYAEKGRYAPSSTETEKYEYYKGYDFNFIFSQTKGNKYYFETKYNIGDEHDFEINNKEIRYCENINYNNYYFKNKKISLWEGDNDYNCEEEFSSRTENIFKDLNQFKIESGCVENHIIISPRDKRYECGNDEYSEELYFDSKHLLELFRQVKSDNNSLEIISIDVLNIKSYPKFIKKIKFFLALKCFYVNDNCIMSNDKLILLLNNLSTLKYLFEIKLNFEKKLKLNEEEKQKIILLFPKININKNCIKWKKTFNKE